jgi:hypothetical protein
MYVYLSESENFRNFKDTNALYWSIKDIEYGNWNGGENNDGIFTYSNQFETTQVTLSENFMITLSPPK